MKINLKLIVIFLEIALIPLIVLGFVVYSSAKNEITSQIVSSLEAIADVQKIRLGKTNHENLQQLILLTNNLTLSQETDKYNTTPNKESQEIIQRILTEEIKILPNFKQISIANLNGNVISSTNSQSIGLNLSQYAYFQTGKNTNTVTHFSKDENGVISLYFAGPIILDNKTIGVLMMSSDGSDIISVVSSYIGLGKTGETLLATRNSNGDALFISPVRFDRNASLTRVVPKDKIKVPITHAVNGEEITMLDAVDYNNIPVIAVTRYIPETNWGIVAKVYQKEAYGPVEKLSNLLTFMLTITAVIIILISFSVAKTITDPINKLAQFANDLAHKNFTTTTTTSINSNDEIGTLARSFNTMSTKLKTYYGQLEQKVKERTLALDQKVAELDKSNKLVSLQAKALESAANGIVITDTQGIIEWVNPAFTTLTGYTAAEAIGQSTRLLHSGRQDKSFYENLWKTILDGRVWFGEMINRHKDGSLYMEEQLITPVKNEHGEITHFIAVKQDITERKQSEEELENSKKAIQNVMEDLQLEKTFLVKERVKDEAILFSIGDGLIVTDDKGVIVQVNKKFETLLGWKENEVLGKNMLDVVQKVDENGDIIPPEKRSLYHVLHGSLPSGKISAISKMHRYICKDKRKLPITGVITPIMLDKKIIGAVQIFRDASFELSIDKAKTEFVSLASHQLRTPLTSINWYVELLQGSDAGVLNDKQKDFLSEIYKGSQLMVQLVNDLLNVSRLESGRLKIEPVPTDLTALIQEIIKEVEPLVQKTGCHISLELPGINVEKVNVDQILLGQVIVNLLTNAIRYSSAGKNGQVLISLAVGPKDYTISVKDNGMGVPKEAQNRIFEKFFRADNARMVVPDGDGMGLYLNKKIMDTSGGTIGFTSEPGQGTAFYVTIPLSGMTPKEGEKRLER